MKVSSQLDALATLPLAKKLNNQRLKESVDSRASPDVVEK
jgi:hypothetical protein